MCEIARASGNRETTAEEVGNERRRKGKDQASTSVPTGKGQTDVKSSTSLEASLATRAKIPCLWVARCKRSSCDFRHPLVCRDYKSGKRCICGSNCLYRHADGEERPSKKSKKESPQGAVAILKEKTSKVVYLKIQVKSVKEKGHPETLPKKLKLMSEILARPSLRNEHLTKPQDKKNVTAKQHGIWQEKNV